MKNTSFSARSETFALVRVSVQVTASSVYFKAYFLITVFAGV